VTVSTVSCGDAKRPKADLPESIASKEELDVVVNRLGGQALPIEPEGAYFVKLTDSRFEARQLEQLSPFQSVMELSLLNTNTDDEALESVSKLKNLRKVYLSETRITDRGLVSIAKLKSLGTLELSKTQVTNKGLVFLGELPMLTDLDLSFTAIHGSEFAPIEGLRALKHLYLDETQTTLSALRHFDRHPSLQDIHTEHEGVGYTVWTRLMGIERYESLWREDRAPGDRSQGAGESQIRADTSYSWARFKPGTSIKLRQSVNGEATIEYKQTLKEVTVGEVIFEVAYTHLPTGMGHQQEERESLYRLDQASSAEESLKVEGKEYRCKLLKSSFEVRTGSVEIRQWIADGIEFPLKTIEITTGARDSTLELTLVNFNSELQIAGRNMKCVKYEGTFRENRAGKGTEGRTSTVWMCAEIPGGMARREMGTGPGVAKGKKVLEVIAFEVKE